MREFDVVSDSPDATRELGARLGQALLASSRVQPVVINLSGELGAGKTTFVSGLLRAVGVTGPVRSPTYTLIEPYELADIAVYHMDLYRLGDARDLEMLALRDLLLPGAALLIEWAERGKGALPSPDLALKLQYQDVDDGRRELAESRRALKGSAYSEAGELLLNKLVASTS
jgi:tRNA threonylcarbamoyladenosine biosynthesis protein TsaE